MTLPLIDLVFFDGCPYVDLARARIKSALDAVSNMAVYREWRDDDPAAPGYVRGLPSPTVLVDGRDVQEGASDSAGSSCRIDGGPTTAAIIEAISRTTEPSA